MALRAAPTVVLLRSASEPDDAYVRAFETAGFRAQCVSVLAFRFPDLEALRERWTHPDRYAGFIVTSPRAVRAVEEMDAAESFRAAWSGKLAYAVGPKTAEALRTLGFAPQGEGTGSAAALGSVIAKKKKPYLFLSGNRRRDTLPDALREAEIAFEELTVYETHLRTDINLPGARRGDWLAFFSPSGIEAMAEHSGAPVTDYRLAAIGPTTGAALRKQGWIPEAVAETPSPAALVEAILEATAGE